MPTERSLLPGEVQKILTWARRWKAIPTRRQIADKFGVSEATVKRIVASRGYPSKKRAEDIEALARSFDPQRVGSSWNTEGARETL